MRAITTYRRVVSWAKGRNPLCFEDVRVDSAVLGSEYGAHCVCTRGLGNLSVVYSFGVGTDASFDLALIERFGVELHAFDPTPRSIEWVQQQTWPEGFVFHPVGIANYDGKGVSVRPRTPTTCRTRCSAAPPPLIGLSRWTCARSRVC